MYNLEGKVAIVTGAGGKRGLGRGIARRLGEEGADVVVVDKYALSHSDKALAEGWQGISSVTDEIKALGRRALGMVCDVSKSAEVDNMVNDVVSKLGKVDILVNNAGFHIYSNIEDQSDDTWDKHISVNLTGTFYCARAVVRDMITRRNGGRIINISSTMGKTGMGDGQTAYTASKFGIVGFTQSLALELARYKILVNAVCPTLTDTDIHTEAFQIQADEEGISAEQARDRMNERIKAHSPLGRLGTPEDIANMVAFLASDEADFITGQSINVNGGAFTAH
ncbi:SDR family NAD(P)-dependent oxidoreductase [Chloroflexota bacterium]